MKENFKQRPLTELCHDRHASWEEEMKLRSSTAGAAIYLVKGHKFPNVSNLRQTSAQQRARIRKVVEKQMEIGEYEQIIADKQADEVEVHMARVVITYIKKEIENLQWKGDAVEYAHHRNIQRQIHKAIQYIKQGEEAMEEMISHIKSTINDNLKALVEEARIENMKDKADQIKSAIRKIAEVTWGRATKVKVEQMASQRENKRKWATEQEQGGRGDKERGKVAKSLRIGGGVHDEVNGAVILLRGIDIPRGYESVVGHSNIWFQPKLRRIGGIGEEHRRASITPYVCDECMLGVYAKRIREEGTQGV
jgi:hypothetical protein